MSMLRVGGPSLRVTCVALRTQTPAVGIFRLTLCQLRGQFQTRAQHNSQQRRQPKYSGQQHVLPSRQPYRAPTNEGEYLPDPEPGPEEILNRLPNIRVRYLRPAIWALAVSSSIYVGFAYLQAKQELKTNATSGGWLQVPQWSARAPNRGPPGPFEVATGAWESFDPITRISYGIIAANSAVHLSSFVVPRFWDTLWHLPARNVNYTQFTSMFVHSGALHFFVNMYFLNNFMTPVGYSRLFEGSPYHTLSFFFSTGVLSGFAQHWSTLIPIQKRAVPEIFIRCGGASGALFGVLGAFCMQYPHAGLGILFVPVHFDAQFVLPAILLFDFVGMIRGYSFVNFGHAVSLFVLLGESQAFSDTSRLISLAVSLVWHILNLMERRTSGSRLCASGNVVCRLSPSCSRGTFTTGCAESTDMQITALFNKSCEVNKEIFLPQPGTSVAQSGRSAGVSLSTYAGRQRTRIQSNTATTRREHTGLFSVAIHCALES
jgi:rhomboid-like protein